MGWATAQVQARISMAAVNRRCFIGVLRGGVRSARKLVAALVLGAVQGLVGEVKKGLETVHGLRVKLRDTDAERDVRRHLGSAVRQRLRLHRGEQALGRAAGAG